MATIVAIGVAFFFFFKDKTKKETTKPKAVAAAFFEHRPASHFSIRSPEFYFINSETQALVKSALAGDLKLASKYKSRVNDVGAVSPNQRDFGFSPLHYAMGANDVEAMRILGNLGADPELKMPNMGMPLLYAIMLNNPELLSELLSIKPVSSLSIATQQHLLFESARRGSPACLKLLLEKGTPIDVKDEAGYTLALRSIDMGKLDLTKWLLINGASAAATTPTGLTMTKSIQWSLDHLSKPGTPHESQLRDIADIVKHKLAQHEK